jgi:hypothetical protein
MKTNKEQFCSKTAPYLIKRGQPGPNPGHPQLLRTERPDRAAFNLLNGNTVIFLEHEPSALPFQDARFPRGVG